MALTAVYGRIQVSLLRLQDGRDERNIRLSGPDLILDPLEPVDRRRGHRRSDPADSQHVLAQPFEHDSGHEPAGLDGPRRCGDRHPGPRADDGELVAPSIIWGATTWPVSSPRGTRSARRRSSAVVGAPQAAVVTSSAAPPPLPRPAPRPRARRRRRRAPWSGARQRRQRPGQVGGLAAADLDRQEVPGNRIGGAAPTSSTCPSGERCAQPGASARSVVTTRSAAAASAVSTAPTYRSASCTPRARGAEGSRSAIRTGRAGAGAGGRRRIRTPSRGRRRR